MIPAPRGSAASSTPCWRTRCHRGGAGSWRGRRAAERPRGRGWRQGPSASASAPPTLDAGCLGLGRFSHRQEVNDLVIDDLGRETQEVVLWGTRRDIMREILERRLDAWPHIRTYATTNLTEAELEARYGGRVASRLAQAAMLLRMPARDWRRAGAERFGWGMA